MKEGKSILIVLALFAFALVVMRRFLGRVSSFLFVPIDKLLFISHSIPPVVMWMLLGLLVGLIYGSFIAIKKYKLDIKLLGYPIGIFIVTISLILIISHFVNKRDNIDEQTDWGNTVGPEIKSAKLSYKKLIEFNEVLNKGIEAVKNEEYQDAETYFKKAALTGRGHSQLDSLAMIYAATANEKCKMFAHDPQLKYIPNHYYKYAAALTSTNPKICK